MAARFHLDLKIGMTGVERGLPAPEVSTKPSPATKKKYHPINTTITFALRHEGNFEFSYFLNVLLSPFASCLSFSLCFCLSLCLCMHQLALRIAQI